MSVSRPSPAVRLRGFGVPLAGLIAACAVALPSAFADYADDFGDPGASANWGEYTLVGGQGSVGWNSGAGTVTLSAANPGAYNFTRITRSGETFNVQQGVSVTCVVSDATTLYWDAPGGLRDPIAMGFDSGSGSYYCEIQRQHVGGQDQVRVRVSRDSSNLFEQAYPGVAVLNEDIVWTVDGTNQTLSIGGAVLINNGAHGQDLSSFSGAASFFQHSAIWLDGSDPGLHSTEFTYVAVAQTTGGTEPPDP